MRALCRELWSSGEEEGAGARAVHARARLEEKKNDGKCHVDEIKWRLLTHRPPRCSYKVYLFSLGTGYVSVG